VLQVGAAAGLESVAIGYDPSGNPNGSFNGDGREVLFRNGVQFVTPNSTNNGYHNPVITLLDGNVGIGTASPAAQLHTTGTVRFATFGAGTLQTDASGNLSVSSDERLKNITGSFNRGLSALQNITPIAYKWKASTGYDKVETYYGFSAQNIQASIPEAIDTDSRGYLTLSDRPILATVINAVNELSTTVTGNQTQNDTSFSSVSTDLAGVVADTLNLNTELSNLLQTVESIQDDVLTLQEQVTTLENASGTGNSDGIFQNGVTVSGLSIFGGITSFLDTTIFEKQAEFKGGAKFERVTTSTADAAGHTTIPSGETKVTVTFANPYETIPVVNATLRSLITQNFRVTEESETGFTIEIDTPETDDIKFSWSAIQTQ
jgi:Chaperone of endosialidase